MTHHARFDAVLANVSDVSSRLGKILAGEKILLDPANPRDKLFMEMLAQADTEIAAKFYYKTPASLADHYFTARQEEVDTSCHYLADTLIEDADKLSRFLAFKNIRNIEIAGSNIRYREPQTYEGALARTGNFVLTPGSDLWGVMQALRLAERRLIEAKAGVVSSNPAFFILNENHSFDRLLTLCGLTPGQGLLTADFAGVGSIVCVAASADELEKQIHTKGREPGKVVLGETPLLTMMAGGTPVPLSHGTGNGEKINDLERIVRMRRYPVDPHHIDEAIGPNPENCELRGSFSGNAWAKFEEVGQAIHDTPVSIIRKNLGKEGIKQAHYIVSDGGISFNDPRVADYFLNHPEFGDHLRTMVHPDIGFPGPESKPVMSAVGGKETFFRMAAEALKKIKAEGGQPDYSVMDHTVFMVGSYDNAGKPDTGLAVRSAVQLQFIVDPNFDDEYDDDIGGRHYTKFPGEALTLAQLDDRDDVSMVRDTAFAKAFGGLMKVCGVDENGLSSTFEARARTDFRVQFDSQIIVKGQSFQHADTIAALWENNIQSTDWAGEIKTVEDLETFFKQNADLVVISGRSVSKAMPAQRLLADWLIPCVAFVDAQTDPTCCKPVVEKTEFTMPFLKTIRHMIHTGVIGERMRDVVEIAHTSEQLKDKIVATSVTAKPRSVREEYPENTVSLRFSSRPNVSMLVSASSQNPRHLDSSYSLTHNLHDYGFGVVTGCGKKSAMGLSVYASLEAAAAGKDIYMAGVQEPVLVKREGFPAEYIEAFFGGVDDNNQANAIIENSRLKRILKILEADKMLAHYNETGSPMRKAHVAVGGAGTLEEVLIALFLKMSEHPAFSDSHVILHNIDQVFKPFIEHMNGTLKANNGYVADSEAEVMKLVGQIFKRPDIRYTHYERPEGVGFYPFEASRNPGLKDLMAKAPLPFKDPNRKSFMSWFWPGPAAE